jgi:hypothetical protein
VSLRSAELGHWRRRAERAEALLRWREQEGQRLEGEAEKQRQRERSVTPLIAHQRTVSHSRANERLTAAGARQAQNGRILL